MPTEVEQKIKELAARHGLQRVVLFGSRARGDHERTSDIDLAVYAEGEISGFVYDLETQAPTLLEFDVTRMTDELESSFVKQVEIEGIVIYDKSRV